MVYPLEEFDLLEEGEWTDTISGYFVRLTITSKKAKALEITFQTVDLCEDCEMYIYPTKELLDEDFTLEYT